MSQCHFYTFILQSFNAKQPMKPNTAFSWDIMKCKGDEQSSNSYNEPPEVIAKTVFYSICTVQAFSSHLRMQQEYPSSSICCYTSGKCISNEGMMKKLLQLPGKSFSATHKWSSVRCNLNLLFTPDLCPPIQHLFMVHLQYYRWYSARCEASV